LLLGAPMMFLLLYVCLSACVSVSVSVSLCVRVSVCKWLTPGEDQCTQKYCTDFKFDLHVRRDIWDMIPYKIAQKGRRQSYMTHKVHLADYAVCTL